ncbi:MAG TPA: hypothetical protein VEH76_03080 [Methylocystis sp.]|nr:hypothetical protein [Methylocystis sp.]
MRTALILGTAISFVMSFASAQTAPDINTMPLDQLARGIAHTIEVSTVRSPGGPLSFDSATVQGANVTIHFTANDQALFVKAKASAGHIRDTTAYAFCRNPQKAVSFKRGISLIYVYELADKSDRIEFAIDDAACAALAAVKPASASELSQMASQVVNELRSDEEKALQTQRGVTLKHLEAVDGVVEQRYVVVAPAFESFYRANIPQTRDMLKGYVCFKFGDSIRRGVRFHLVYEQIETGAKLSDFNIGPSDC